METYRGVVYPDQMDHMGHMNVRWYTGRFDEGTWSLFSRIGITRVYIDEQKKGMAAVKQTTHYKKEVVAGDLLLIRSEILEITEKSIRFVHRMFNVETGEEVADTELIGVHIDLVKRASCSFPGNIRNNAEKLIKNL